MSLILEDIQDKFTKNMQGKYDRISELKKAAFYKFIYNNISEEEFKNLLMKAGFGDTKIKEFLKLAIKEKQAKKIIGSAKSNNLNKKNIVAPKGLIDKVKECLKGSEYYLDTIIKGELNKDNKPYYFTVYLKSKNKMDMGIGFNYKGGKYFAEFDEDSALVKKIQKTINSYMGNSKQNLYFENYFPY